MTLGFSKVVTHFYGSRLVMTFEFSRISETTLEASVEYLQRHFLNHPVCSFFLEQTLNKQIDLLVWVLRYPVQCTGLELLAEPPQKWNLLQITSKTNAVLLFPNNLLVCNLKVLFLRKKSYLRHFWYLEGSWLNVISSFCQKLLLRANYSLVHIIKI